MLMPTFKRQAGGTKNKTASQLQDKGEHLHARTKEGPDTSSAKNNEAFWESVCPFFNLMIFAILKQTNKQTNTNNTDGRQL